MKLKHIKPYLYILVFLIIPLLFVPFIRGVKNNFYEHNEGHSLPENKIIDSDSISNDSIRLNNNELIKSEVNDDFIDTLKFGKDL